MDAIQKLIQAISSLLWPLITIGLLLSFRPAIAAIIESAKSRKFTLKIGGQELTMEEANQVQQNLIADLQARVTEIQKELAGSGNPVFSESPVLPGLVAPAASSNVERIASETAAEPRRISRILWVDDNPKNNSYFIQRLTDRGVHVDLAESTSAGIKLFSSESYDYIISDMGRRDGLNYRSTAGIELLRLIRDKSKTVPFVFFSSASAMQAHGAEALSLGATAFTSSPTELFGMLDAATTTTTATSKGQA
ncbi:response regulator [Acidicapsa ligni]|uniref:response regulator n=1 Tax=Acidicapsa ligni TaxID=542300 RepID=UPI0021E08F38|nr:response regulator [Acidicapsa ligni]